MVAQLDTEASELVEPDADQHRTVVVQNLGPNAIYLEVGEDATVEGGLRVAATNGVSPPIRIPPGAALSAIAATAEQEAPADTRYIVT